MILAGTYPTRGDAELAQSALSAAGIPSVLSSDDAGGAYPFDLTEAVPACSSTRRTPKPRLRSSTCRVGHDDAFHGRERTDDGRELHDRTLRRNGGSLHWSLIAVFALIVWSLADGVFPSENPGLSDGTYLGAATVAALLFLASILLHELGHSLVARREGIEVDSITLWLFGGVAEFNDRFATAGSEFRVALAGPLVSIVVGLLFISIALAGLPSAVDGAAAWLGYINLVLAAFNLLPASPLDGGRVLHAALWRARGDYAWATRVASEIGQGFGYLFIALGLLMFIFQGSFSGAWLAFIGWYLLQGAKAEARYLATEQALSGLRVRDLMVRRPVTVEADSTIGRFMDDVASSHRFTTYPVLDEGSPVGLLPFASVVAVQRSEWETRRVRDRWSRSTRFRCSRRTRPPWTP